MRLIENLMKGIQSVFLEKRELQYGKTSLLIALSDKFGLLNLRYF